MKKDLETHFENLFDFLMESELHFDSQQSKIIEKYLNSYLSIRAAKVGIEYLKGQHRQNLEDRFPVNIIQQVVDTQYGLLYTISVDLNSRLKKNITKLNVYQSVVLDDTNEIMRETLNNKRKILSLNKQ